MPLYVPTVVPYVTALPSSPYDGQEVYYGADPTNGVVWHLRYRAAASGSFKWDVVGGPALESTVMTSQTTTSTTYAALATAGPSITVPLAGDYDADWGARLQPSVVSKQTNMGLDIGATAATDAEAISFFSAVGLPAIHHSMKRRLTGLAASTAIVAKYRTDSGGTLTAEKRWLRVTPVRVG